MRATALISQSALIHNLSIVKKYANKAKIVAMVKANAYGHKLDMVTPIVNNADILAVSELSEVQKLRKLSDKPILLLSGIYSQQELQIAIQLKCIIVVHQLEQVAIIANTIKHVNIWLKIDTGMHRLGLNSEQYQDATQRLSENKLIDIKCIMSHFSCSDEMNNSNNSKQLQQFCKLTNNSDKRSMANSAAIISIKDAIFDFVRPGIMLYGASPFSKYNNILQPVMRLVAPILSIKTIAKADTVGYGATWVADKITVVAIIGIGYGDGYPRHAKNGTPVLVNNKIAKLIGRVSMDSICVDITDIKTKVGDIVTLWGDVKVPVETIANCSNTIAYELLTKISSRVQFSQSK